MFCIALQWSLDLIYSELRFMLFFLIWSDDQCKTAKHKKIISTVFFFYPCWKPHSTVCHLLVSVSGHRSLTRQMLLQVGTPTQQPSHHQPSHPLKVPRVHPCTQISLRTRRFPKTDRSRREGPSRSLFPYKKFPQGQINHHKYRHFFFF